MAYSPEIRQQAGDLYVCEGMTQEEVSRAAGVPMRTVSAWSKDDDWVTRRKEREDRKRRFKESLESLAETMVEQAKDTKHSQDAIAAMGLAKLTLLKEKKEDSSSKLQIDRPKIFLENLEFMVDVLREIDQEGLKILARNFDEILRRFKEFDK